ncbi:SDR family NAD(P)-dependent oxidoreductase [Acetobacterium bakii]|uniref:NAD-dependent epimerase n=1 Tax=Acetobacterium bakii TaxID=52689 RepID=A0A0L6U0I8_9FIRM|nr:SDR family NAD(P)-dependent oxidoreductase [Acetobacterium bakii]KNZ42029.1 NAD-dependent epimerase [Acetobacterium bakii]
MRNETSTVYLITGAAGFIGYFLAKKLLDQECQVIGIDNMNDYYDVRLKVSRLEQLEAFEKFSFIKGDIADKTMVYEVFQQFHPDIVINLAAQAGVRYSIENPDVYIKSNVVGFFNILEACRHYPVEHLVYASSSSVYGLNSKVPFEETDVVDYPISLYGATKKANETMAYTYSHLYKIPATGLRFFTVYGPLGRPDMAYYQFTERYFTGEAIEIFNNGDFEHDLYRDFTYIDDIIEGIIRLLPKPPTGEVPYNLFNIGNSRPVRLMVFIETLEKCLSRSTGREVVFKKKFEPLKPGDVSTTYASTEALEKAVGFKPKISIEQGLQKFSDWFVSYNKLNCKEASRK